MKWKPPTGQVRGLLNAAHAHALAHEPTPEFPGIDMDAIHKKPTLSTVIRAVAKYFGE